MLVVFCLDQLPEQYRLMNQMPQKKRHKHKKHTKKETPKEEALLETQGKLKLYQLVCLFEKFCQKQKGNLDFIPALAFIFERPVINVI